MAKTGRDYIYGSLAPEIKEQQSPGPSIRVLPGQQLSSDRPFKLFTIIVISLAFVMMLSIVYRYAVITEKNYALASTESQNRKLQNDINNLKIELDSSVDKNAIAEYAVNQLGMQLPDSSQKIYVKVPSADITQIRTGNEASDKGLIQNVADGLKGLFGLLF